MIFMEAKMIGSKIAEARKKINFSQAQLAQRLFISPQAVGKWERGESLPDLLTFNRLAEILGVDLNYFSENFQSVVAKSISVKSSVMQSTELLPKSRRKSGVGICLAGTG
jgi:transcriptional regulator with XRE-family HTH domain